MDNISYDIELMAEEICDAQHYSEDELPFVTELTYGAVSFLKNAGAYDERIPLTRTAITLIVGHWLEHRESNYKDFRNIGDFSIGIESIITQLKYTSGDRYDETSTI